MPHISNKKLSDKDYKNIYNQLVSIFDTAGRKLKSDMLLKEFLTDTEKIMLAKRLAVLYMLDENISKHYISEVLLVSSSTVDRISLRYEIGKHPYIRNIIKKNKKKIWSVIGEAIEHGIQVRTGKKRYEWFNEINRKYNKTLLKS